MPSACRHSGPVSQLKTCRKKLHTPPSLQTSYSRSPDQPYMSLDQTLADAAGSICNMHSFKAQPAHMMMEPTSHCWRAY